MIVTANTLDTVQRIWKTRRLRTIVYGLLGRGECQHVDRGKCHDCYYAYVAAHTFARRPVVVAYE